MKKQLIQFIGLTVIPMLVSLGLSSGGSQEIKKTTDKVPISEALSALKAKITSVTPEYQYNDAINLITTGLNFGRKSDGVRNRKLRLAPASRGDSAGVFYDDGMRMWTNTRIEGFLSFNVVPGKKYKAGIVEYQVGQLPGSGSLVSNEVEFLLLIKIQSVNPSPVPLGVGEITAETVNELGPQGSKIVKFGNQQAAVTSWAGSKFKFVIPPGLLRPAAYDLFVEENGQAVSTKLNVKLLGPAIGNE